MDITGTAATQYSKDVEDNYTYALVILSTLFFMWGFLTVLNDILIPHLKNVFNLSYTQAILIQFCFFAAYFVCSLPAGQVVKRVGYQNGIVFGLLIAASGCLLFLPASSLESYPLFLGALFVLASGITLLQVAANPYVTLLGSPATASRRLNLTQAFNSLGTTVGPWIGGSLILSGVAIGGSDTIRMPYTVLASVLLALAITFVFLKLPRVHLTEQINPENTTVTSYRHLVLGVAAIFLYVGAEVSIGSFLINFMGEASIAGMEEAQASKYVSYYWGGAMVGRFIGVALMFVVAPNIMLVANSIGAVAMLAITILAEGSVAMWALIAVGLFNSLMFPTIFSLSISKLGFMTSKGSGVLCMAIVGGAVVPLAQGILADTIGLQMSFVLPVFCYLYVLYYGFSGYQPIGPGISKTNS